jgi:NADH dehydrogenase FAD-containing subunit
LLVKVLIVGGGYAGASLARKVDPIAEVVLIEPREAFVHNVAAIRAVADPAVLDQLALPYDRLLKRGRVIRARAETIDDGRVRSSDGQTFDGDVIVVATGSHYALPFKPADDSVESFKAQSQAAHRALHGARHVAIVGGGAVGVELAGEISAAFPRKAVTLISSNQSLFPQFPPKLGRRILRQLEREGVNVRLGATAQGLKDRGRPGSGPVALSDGSIIDADLVFPAIGAKPETTVLQGLMGAGLAGDGRIVVDSWLRPAGRSSIFALGDMAATGDHMTIVGATRQVAWLARTISALAAGAPIEALAGYTPWSNPPILAPLGPSKGASALPGMVVGAHLTSLIKGKALFLPRYRKEFGLGRRG